MINCYRRICCKFKSQKYIYRKNTEEGAIVKYNNITSCQYEMLPSWELVVSQKLIEPEGKS